MPTVSAALGCSPTARVRRPQRDRNSSTCRTMTMMTVAMAIGPWSRTACSSQPTTGRLVTLPRQAEGGELAGLGR